MRAVQTISVVAAASRRPRPGAIVRSSAPALSDVRRCLASISNANLAPALLVQTVDKAVKILTKGAYVHRYEALGLERADFDAATDDLLTVIDAYDARFGYDGGPPEDRLVTT